MLLFKNTLRRLLQEAYEKGLGKGYELGYMMGQTEHSNRGIIIGSRVDREIEETKKQERERIKAHLIKQYLHKVGVSDGDMWTGNRVGYESWLEIPLEHYDREQGKQVMNPDWQALK